MQTPSTNSAKNRTAAELVVELVQHLEDKGIQVVYLRNYQSLPNDIGNDVDLLIPRGRKDDASVAIQQLLTETEWRIVHQVEFSPRSLFLSNRNFSSFIHIDLFDRIEWHWVEYADCSSIFDERRWNGMIHHPSEHHEVFINLMTRLVYNGTVRQKHRIEAATHVLDFGNEALAASLSHQFGGRNAERLLECLSNDDWKSIEGSVGKLRGSLVLRKCFSSPVSCLTGIYRYLKRGITRTIRSPGPMIVIEGADGVGKSTLIDKLVPAMQAMTGRKDVLMFHWKPDAKSIRLPGQPSGNTSSPRAREPRSSCASLAYLVYHWLGFWFGYFRHLAPAMAANRAVLADRYAYEFELDPHRLRIKLPAPITRLASRYSPTPNLIFALVSMPESVRSRKPELTIPEIKDYQQRLLKLIETNPSSHQLDADKPPDEVLTEALEVLSRNLFQD